jgi:hypothetical protein
MATKHRAEARCWPAPQSQSKMMDDTVEPHRPARPHEKRGLVKALGKNPSSAMRRAAAKQNRRVATRITAAMFDRCRRDRRFAPSQNAIGGQQGRARCQTQKSTTTAHADFCERRTLRASGCCRPRVPVGFGASYCAAVCNFVQTCAAKERILKVAPHRKVSCNGEIRDCQGKHFR